MGGVLDKQELFLHIESGMLLKKVLSQKIDYQPNSWDDGYIAGYKNAMEIVLEVLNLQDDFKKWSEEHEKNKNS